MRVKGLPIGQGEVWHDQNQRTATMSLAAFALTPFVCWLLAAANVLSADRYLDVVEPILLGTLVVAVLFVGTRWPAIARRLGAGAVAGLASSLAYNALIALVHPLVPKLVFPLDATAALPPQPGAHGLHWLAAGVAWGLAYALVAGKAEWYFGAVWSAMIFAAITLGAIALPQGSLLAGLEPLALAALFAIHAIYGMLLGGLNYALQPEARGRGKIIFLRDYAPKVKQR